MIVQIRDICSAVYSGGTPNRKHLEYYEGGDIPWLNTSEVVFNRIYKTEKHITQSGLKNSSAKWIPENSVIVAMYGATAGRTAIAKKPLTTNQACCNLIIDPEKADYRYVYYYLYSKYQHLLSMANGGAQQNLNAGQIKEYMINLPDLQTQKKIADILDLLDSKIELNNTINNNLEQQAQTIYQQMFIDNARSDWAEGTLSDIADITMGQSPSGSSYNEDGTGTIFFQGRAEFGFRFPSVRLYTTEPKRMAQSNDTLMSVRAPVGDLNVAHMDCCIGRGLAAIHSKSHHQSFVLYTMFSLKKQLDVFNGEGTVFGSINHNSLNDMPILIPSDDILDEFERIVAPMDLTIRNNYDENCRLQDIRDTLLPRLMSGELDVSDIDI